MRFFCKHEWKDMVTDSKITKILCCKKCGAVKKFKLDCQHDWEEFFNQTVVNSHGDVLYNLFHFKCQNCGEFKKVKSVDF